MTYVLKDNFYPYVFSHMMTEEHRMWAIGLYTCELLNFLNVVLQVITNSLYTGC